MKLCRFPPENGMSQGTLASAVTEVSSPDVLATLKMENHFISALFCLSYPTESIC